VRKTKVVVVPFDGRDFHKQFIITEMPASQAERWGMRAILGMLTHTQVELPEGWEAAPMLLAASMGMKVLASVPFETSELLAQELMTCIQVKALPESEESTVVRDLVMPRALFESDIEEIATRAWLKAEVFELHTGFSVADTLSKLVSAISVMMSWITSTSQEQSEPPSPDASPLSTN
jgi:hypothetical protein